MPLSVRKYDPQLTIPASEPPAGAEWVHEPHFAGQRLAAIAGDGVVRLVSGDQVDCTAFLVPVTDAVRQLRCSSALLDGQVVLSEEDDNQRLPGLSLPSGARLRLTYLVFDLLELDGIELTKLTLAERKAQLEALVGAEAGVLKYLPHFEHSSKVVEYRGHAGCDAIVSKRRSDQYLPGPTGSWLKAPLRATADKATSE